MPSVQESKTMQAVVAALVAMACCLFSGTTPVVAQDASEIVLRLGRLENQVRQMSGEIEQLRFENRQLREQVNRFTATTTPVQPDRTAVVPPPAGNTVPPGPPPISPVRRGDSFDPANNPDAPGVPRSLGTTAPSAPLRPDERVMEHDDGTPMDGEFAMDPQQPLDLSTLPRQPRTTPSIAAASPNANPTQEFDAANDLLQAGEYEQAEMAFRRFLQSHPRDPMVPNAMYGLGQSYAKRARHREAAEQFLEVTTKYPNAQHAPDALVKLAAALDGLGARDRACAVYAETARKYPQASPMVLQAAERERKRLKCP